MSSVPEIYWLYNTHNIFKLSYNILNYTPENIKDILL
jgi:hypothetical protein